MEAARQAQVAFFLTGKRPVELAPLSDAALTPALLAPYRDLPRIRHDYPVVLFPEAPLAGCVRPLSALVDEAMTAAASDDGTGPEGQALLCLEAAVRKALANGERGSLARLLMSEIRAGDDGEDAKPDAALAQALAALPGDAEVLDCDARLPEALLRHVWRTNESRKAHRLSERLARLALASSDILRADEARSESGRSPARLRAAFGGLDSEAFDFEAMSRVLVRTANRSTLTAKRRLRLERIISTLQSFSFDPVECCFDSCARALAAWEERHARLIAITRAVAIAELEIAGDYREDRHDAFFDDYGADGLTPEDLSLFPDFLVCLNAAAVDGEEQAALMEILASGLSMKVLLQTDDVLEDTRPGAGSHGFKRSAPHFASMAVGLGDVFVLQMAASHIPRLIDRVADGLAHAGAALFSVYSGATATNELPAYLAAAAAVEARAFPNFSHDPGAGPRFDLQGNPEPEADWPTIPIQY